MPEYWDAPHRDHADHIRRLRKTPGAEHLPDDPNKYEWLLGNDGSGEYNRALVFNLVRVKLMDM